MIPYFVFEEINLGFVRIQFWGLMLVTAILVGLWILWKETKKLNISGNIILNLALIIVIGSLVGARFYYVLNELPYFIENPVDIFKVWQGGMGFFGGLIFAVFFGWLYLKKKGIKFFIISDIVVISLAIGEAITRIGCFCIHDHLGKVTNFPLGIQYMGEVRHETALYSLVNTLILFIVLLILRRKEIGKKEGFLTAFYMVWYGAITFFIYSLRATDLPGSDPTWGILRPSQYFSLLLFILGLVIFIKKIKRA